MLKNGLVQSARFDEDEATALRAAAVKLGVKNAEFIRRAVDVFTKALNGEDYAFIIEYNKKIYDKSNFEIVSESEDKNVKSV